MAESVSALRSLLRELYEHFTEIEEIPATLEELMDKEGLKRVEGSLREYERRGYVIAVSPERIRGTLMKDRKDRFKPKTL